MYLTKVKIENYRLITNAQLDVDKRTTLIVGRNNTAKTSFLDCLKRTIGGKSISYNDYPLSKRNQLIDLTSRFMEKTITYEQFIKDVPKITVELTVDYSPEGDNDNLGALSPFIIDVDENTATAVIRIEYHVKVDENALFNLFEHCYYNNGEFSADLNETKNTYKKYFSKIFDRVIYAINPNDTNDTQIKESKELEALFPIYDIPAERILGEDGDQNNDSLSTLISTFFSVDNEELKPEVAEQVQTLKKTVEEANRDIQKNSDDILSSLVNQSIGFGYPNAEELQLAVNTKLSIDEQIKNRSELTYILDGVDESLPSTYNGLGYKNLIKIEFLLAAFAREIEAKGVACIPLLFLEEPESHMHPQMQQMFASYLETFIDRFSNISLQTLLTTHSSHIANTMEFSKIRYAQRTSQGVIYKNLDEFAKQHSENLDFIRKYLTISRCDMFFADKLIFVEGASERLLIPDMIEKCKNEGLFDSKKYKLSEQYYALIEIGGAYAHLFIPFADFLGTPCLILTDIDSTRYRKKVVVSEGVRSSNSTINRWVKTVKNYADSKKVTLAEIIKLTSEQKTNNNCHLEFQVEENGLCGRSLEESIINVNREIFGLTRAVTEEKLNFSGKSKTDFALDLIINHSTYKVPQYIKNGLAWLNNQSVIN